MNRSSQRKLIVLLMLTAGLTWGACTRRSAASVKRAPNVILISIDTLRPDHLGCYGYAKPTTPFIDSFRADSILFRTTIASAPSTLPSHASMFTSLPPQNHGASHVQSIPLGSGILTVAQVFRDAGYQTAAVVGGGQLAAEYGLNRGFEAYEEAQNAPFANIVARALPFLRGGHRRPFFLFLHTYEVHHPYTPSPEDFDRFSTVHSETLPYNIEPDLLDDINHKRIPITPDDLAHIVAAYDGEIRGMDRAFGFLVSALRKANVYDDTVIVFTSDHGEEFGEHGMYGWHSHTLFDELLKVPLLVKLPANRYAGLEIGGYARSVDIAPMLVEIAGLQRRNEFQDFRFFTAVSRKMARELPVVLWRETFPGETIRHYGLRTAEWKLSDGHLYDLLTDPREQTDVSATKRDVDERLQREYEELVGERPRPSTRNVRPDPSTVETLRSLGYLR